MSRKKYTSTAAIAPTWMTAVNPTTALSSTGMPIRPSVIFRCPVEETGRNSVRPSTIPRTMACPILITLNGPVPLQPRPRSRPARGPP